MKHPEPEPDERQRTAEEGRIFIGLLLLVSLYERGVQRPQHRTRQRLAEAVNVDLAAIEALFPTFERLRAIARGERRVGGDRLVGMEALAQSIGEAVRERVEVEGLGVLRGHSQA